MRLRIIGAKEPRMGRLDGKVAIQNVVLLGAVFEKIPMADALISDAIANEQIVGSMNRHETIARIPDAGADDSAAAHG